MRFGNGEDAKEFGASVFKYSSDSEVCFSLIDWFVSLSSGVGPRRDWASHLDCWKSLPVEYRQSAFRAMQFVQGGPFSSHLIRLFLHLSQPWRDFVWGRLGGMTFVDGASSSSRKRREGEKIRLKLDITKHISILTKIDCRTKSSLGSRWESY